MPCSPGIHVPSLPLWIDNLGAEHARVVADRVVPYHAVSHAHDDHIKGADANWRNGLIFCSHVTRALLLSSPRMDGFTEPWRIVSMPLDVTVRIPVVHPQRFLCSINAGLPGGGPARSANGHGFGAVTAPPLAASSTAVAGLLADRLRRHIDATVRRNSTGCSTAAAAAAAAAEESLAALFGADSVIGWFNLTLIEAAHIPGSAMVLVDLDAPVGERGCRRFLYTGDFRTDATNWATPADEAIAMLAASKRPLQHEQLEDAPNEQQKQRPNIKPADLLDNADDSVIDVEIGLGDATAKQQQQMMLRFDGGETSDAFMADIATPGDIELRRQHPALFHLVRFLRRSGGGGDAASAHVDCLFVDTTWMHVVEKTTRQTLLNAATLRTIFRSVAAVVRQKQAEHDARAERLLAALEERNAAAAAAAEQEQEQQQQQQHAEAPRGNLFAEFQRAKRRVPYVICAYLHSHFGKEVLLQGLARLLGTTIGLPHARFQRIKAVAEAQREQRERGASGGCGGGGGNQWWDEPVDLELFKCVEWHAQTDGSNMDLLLDPPLIHVVSTRADVHPKRLSERMRRSGGVPHYGMYLTGWSALRKAEIQASQLNAVARSRMPDVVCDFARQLHFGPKAAEPAEKQDGGSVGAPEQPAPQTSEEADVPDHDDDDTAATLSALDEVDQGSHSTAKEQQQQLQPGMPLSERLDSDVGLEDSDVVGLDAFVWAIPFSLHSSRTDIAQLVGHLRPKIIHSLSGPRAVGNRHASTSSSGAAATNGAATAHNGGGTALGGGQHQDEMPLLGGDDDDLCLGGAPARRGRENTYGVGGYSDASGEQDTRALEALRKQLWPLLRAPGNNQGYPVVGIVGCSNGLGSTGRSGSASDPASLSTATEKAVKAAQMRQPSKMKFGRCPDAAAAGDSDDDAAAELEARRQREAERAKENARMERRAMKLARQALQQRDQHQQDHE